MSTQSPHDAPGRSPIVYLPPEILHMIVRYFSPPRRLVFPTDDPTVKSRDTYWSWNQERCGSLKAPDSHTLRSLVQTCQRLSQVALPYLYQSVNLQSRTSLLRLVNTISRDKPDNGQYIKDLCVSECTKIRPRTFSRVVTECNNNKRNSKAITEAMAQIHTGLQSNLLQLDALHSLIIVGIPGYTTVKFGCLPPLVDAASALPSLRRLVLKDFLFIWRNLEWKKMEHIEELHFDTCGFDNDPDEVKMVLDCFPNLRTLVVDHTVFFPGPRTFTVAGQNLETYICRLDCEEVMPDMGLRQMPKLKHLKIGVEALLRRGSRHSWKPRLSREFLSLTPTLTSLQLMCGKDRSMCTSLRQPQLRNRHLNFQLIAALFLLRPAFKKGFRKLKTLDVSDWSPPWFPGDVVPQVVRVILGYLVPEFDAYGITIITGHGLEPILPADDDTLGPLPDPDSLGLAEQSGDSDDEDEDEDPFDAAELGLLLDELEQEDDGEFLVINDLISAELSGSMTEDDVEDDDDDDDEDSEDGDDDEHNTDNGWTTSDEDEEGAGDDGDE